MTAMRQRVADKLRDRGGVTILMALFAMLVASMVCIVILGAAVTSVKQAKTQQTQEQNTLALQSAAELVRSEIANGGDITFTGVPSDNTVLYQYDSTNNATTSISGPMETLTTNALSVADPSASFTVHSQADEGGSESYRQDVEVQLVLNPDPDPSNGNILPETIATAAERAGDINCQLIVTLSTTGPEGQEGEKQYLFLKYPQSKCTVVHYPAVIENGVEKTPEKYTATFIWKSGNFYLAEDVNSVE